MQCEPEDGRFVALSLLCDSAFLINNILMITNQKNTDSGGMFLVIRKYFWTLEFEKIQFVTQRTLLTCLNIVLCEVALSSHFYLSTCIEWEDIVWVTR